MSSQCWWLIYIVGIGAFVCGLIVANIIIEKIYAGQEETASTELKEFHQPPSWIVKAYETYLNWCGVTICKKCGLHAHEMDFWPSFECPQCGVENTLVKRPIVSKRGYWNLATQKWTFK